MSNLAARLRDSRQFVGLRETWVRLNRIDLASKPVISTLVFAHVVTAITFEVGRIGRDPLSVLAVVLIAEVFFWAGYITLYALQLSLSNPKISAVYKLFVLFITNTLRIFVLEFGYLRFGLIEDVSISERILGDSTGIILVMVGIAYVQVVMTELSKQEIDLQAANQALIESSRASRDNAKLADAQLRAKAQYELGEQLEALAEGLSSAKVKRVGRLTQEIRDLIEFKVRPLSAGLLKQLVAIDSEPLKTAALRKTRLPRAIQPDRDFRGAVVFAYGGLNIFVTTPGLSNWSVGLLFGLVTLSFPPLAGLIGSLYPKGKSHALFPGLVIVSFMATLAWSPSIVFLMLRSREYPDLSLLALTSTLVILVATNGVAFWSAFKRERTEYLEKIERLNHEQARQLAILDQAVWVARKHWSYLIHGTVQGALTVALAKLQLSKTLTAGAKADVLADVERAKRALEQEAGFSQNWEAVVREIQDTWNGVCELKITVSDDASQKLKQFESTATCTAEIIKELVSNAFRHGNANEVSVQVSLDRIGDLMLVSTNNGSQISKTKTLGVGSEMFEELTASWSWRNTPSGPRFTASIPIPG